MIASATQPPAEAFGVVTVIQCECFLSDATADFRSRGARSCRRRITKLFPIVLSLSNAYIFSVSLPELRRARKYPASMTAIVLAKVRKVLLAVIRMILPAVPNPLFTQDRVSTHRREAATPGQRLRACTSAASPTPTLVLFQPRTAQLLKSRA